MNKMLFLSLIISCIVIFSLSPLLIPPIIATEDSWTIMEPMPTPRAGIGVAVVDRKIYVIGGHDWGNYFGTNEMYDPATNTWANKTSMPTPRSNFGIAVVDNKIYVIGGATGDWEYTNVTEVYDPLTDTWETRASMPTPRNALEANVVNGKIYLIGGGRRGPLYADFDVNEVYDPSTDSWTTKTPLPTGVQYYASAVVDSKIYIMRGSLNQIYDPETDIWSNGASPPTSVDQSAAGVTTGITTGDPSTGRIHVLGGTDNLDAVNLNQVYDPETDTWVDGAEMPTARYSLGVAVIDDSLYAIGGHEGYFGTPISPANERYIPLDDEAIPEFPSLTPILFALTVIVVAVFIYRRKLLKT